MSPPKELYNTSIVEGEDEEFECMPEIKFRKFNIRLLRSNQKQIYELNESFFMKLRY